MWNGFGSYFRWNVKRENAVIAITVSPPGQERFYQSHVLRITARTRFLVVVSLQPFETIGLNIRLLCRDMQECKHSQIPTLSNTRKCLKHSQIPTLGCPLFPSISGRWLMLIVKPGLPNWRIYREIPDIWRILKAFGYKYLVWRFGEFLASFWKHLTPDHLV